MPPTEPSALSLIEKRQDRLDLRLYEQGKEIDEIKEELVTVPIMKRAFNTLAVVLTGAIVAIIGAAAAIILSGGAPR